MTCANRTKGFKVVEGFAYGVGLTPSVSEFGVGELIQR